MDMRVEWNSWWFSITLGSIRVVWSHDSRWAGFNPPQLMGECHLIFCSSKKWIAGVCMVLGWCYKVPKYWKAWKTLMSFKALWYHVFCTLGVAWSLLTRCVHAVRLVSPRLEQGIAEAKAKSDPSRLEPWVFKKSHCQHWLPLLTSIQIIHQYSSST